MQTRRDEIAVGVVAAFRDGLQVIKCRAESSEQFAAMVTKILVTLEDFQAIYPYIVEIQFLLWIDNRRPFQFLSRHRLTTNVDLLWKM